MAILEAMAAGLPIISTRVGAIGEVITDEREGYLIEARDVTALADRLCRLSRSGAVRKRMGAAARRRVQQEFGMDVMVERLVAIYREVVG